MIYKDIKLNQISVKFLLRCITYFIKIIMTKNNIDIKILIIIFDEAEFFFYKTSYVYYLILSIDISGNNSFYNYYTIIIMCEDYYIVRANSGEGGDG